MLGAIIGAVGTLAGSLISSRSAKKAAQAQTAADMAALEENRRQFNVVREALSPYMKAGEDALGGLLPYTAYGPQAFDIAASLTGLRGAEAQQAAVSEVLASPIEQARMQAMREQVAGVGAARGRLRTGETQFALGEIPVSIIDQYMARLQPFVATGLGVQERLAGMGQASAAGLAAPAMQSAQLAAQSLGGIGAARAGQALAQGQIQAATVGNLAQQLGQYFGRQQYAPPSGPLVVPPPSIPTTVPITPEPVPVIPTGP